MQHLLSGSLRSSLKLQSRLQTVLQGDLPSAIPDKYTRLRTYTLLQGEPFFGFAANNLQPKADILDKFFPQTQAYLAAMKYLE